MIRNLKALGLALVAVLALGAMGASTASAADFTTLSGATLDSVNEGKVQFTVTGQEVFCEESKYNGTAPANEFTSVNVTPVYNKCQTGLGTTATIDGFGAGECYFVLYASGTSDLECAPGKEVTVTAATCVVHIPPQKGLHEVKYTTITKNGLPALTLDLNVQKIKGNHTDGFLCPFGSSGNAETGILEGKIEVWATKPAGTQVFLTDHP